MVKSLKSSNELLQRLSEKLNELDSSLKTRELSMDWAAQTAALLGYKYVFRSSFNMHATCLNSPKPMTSKQISEAQRISAEWFFPER